MARRLLVRSSVRSERRSLSRPRLSVPSVNVLDRMLMQVLRLGNGLVRHVPTQGADGLERTGADIADSGPASPPFHLHPSTARANHPPLLKRQIEVPACGIDIPPSAHRAVAEGLVPRPAAEAHGSFSHRTTTSRAWGSQSSSQPPSAGSDLRKGDLRGECLGLPQGVAWTTTSKF